MVITNINPEIKINFSKEPRWPTFNLGQSKSLIVKALISIPLTDLGFEHLKFPLKSFYLNNNVKLNLLDTLKMRTRTVFGPTKVAITIPWIIIQINVV